MMLYQVLKESLHEKSDKPTADYMHCSNKATNTSLLQVNW